MNITDRFSRSASTEPDAIPEPYLGVGYELQQTRKARGLAIAGVASELRIQEPFLVALEEGRFDDLPGPAYAAGFLRSYADFLAVDRTQVMELYRSETGMAAAKPDLRFPQPLKASSRPSKWLLVLLAVVIFSGYGIWYYGNYLTLPDIEAVAALPDSLKRYLDGTPEQIAAKSQATSKPVAAAPQPAPTAGDVEKAPADTLPTLEARKEMQAAVKEDLAAGSDGANRDAADGRPEPAPTLETRPSAVTEQSSTPALSPPPSNPQVYGAGHRDSRIVVVAREDSWVQVKGTGNDLLLTRMLKAGDSYRVPNRRDLTLTTGNAGAIEIIVDGRLLGRLGPQGAVRRNVALIAEELLGRFGAGADRKANETNSQ